MTTPQPLPNQPSGRITPILRGPAGAVAISSSLVIAAFVIEGYMPTPKGGIALGGVLQSAMSKEIDLLTDMTKLLINWALGLVAVSALLVRSMWDKKVSLTRHQALALESSIAFAMISVFFGHLVLSNTIELLQLDLFSIAQRGIAWYASAQYWTMVVSLCGAIIGAHEAMWQVVGADA